MGNDQIATTEVGMLLVGHGTRDKQGVAEFLETARLIAELVPSVAVEPGFLELAEPSIGEALERLVARDVREIIVVPLLLFAAGHAKQDIPNSVAIAAARFPHLKIRQAEPLGCHENILAASAERFQSVLPPGEFQPATDVGLIMVSRGTSDLSAIAEVSRFVRLRRELTPVAFATTAFMAVAEPAVATELEAIARSSHSCVIVQPHLLFQGKLTNDLRAIVQSKQAECPAKRWLVADHLGPCKLVAEAAISRFLEARADVD
ncbi:MAG: sirohydrochlorin chelatase [Planctomycetota bacterium]|nr:sirohydrochlorin chelatase [Planctomycetota bacterium]